MTLLERMDRLVYATHLDRIIFKKAQPHTLRWTPLFVIAALLAGYVLMARTKGLPDLSFFIGWLLFYGGFLTSALVRTLGPRFTSTALCPLDERELIVKAQTHAISGVVLASFAMLACFYMATSGLPGLWHPQGALDWVNLGFGIQACGLLLPTWIASWLQPRPAFDHED